MIQNRFVILWDNTPIGIDDSTGYPYKTYNPNMIHYYLDRVGAEHYLSVVTIKGNSEQFTNMRIIELQFRII